MLMILSDGTKLPAFPPQPSRGFVEVDLNSGELQIGPGEPIESPCRQLNVSFAIGPDFWARSDGSRGRSADEAENRQCCCDAMPSHGTNIRCGAYRLPVSALGLRTRRLRGV
jgi:hypothetical protein